MRKSEICSVENCSGRTEALGYCSKHYQRNYKYGSPTHWVGYAKENNPRWDNGKRSHELYFIYQDMVSRCTRETHSRYQDYGGRGIRVCKEWVDDFWKFAEYVGKRPEGRTKGGRSYWQLDRIDNDGDYEPGNVRWATPSQQANNRRKRKRRTHCRKGHLFNEETTYINPTSGDRRCRECARYLDKKRRRRNGL